MNPAKSVLSGFLRMLAWIADNIKPILVALLATVPFLLIGALAYSLSQLPAERLDRERGPFVVDTAYAELNVVDEAVKTVETESGIRVQLRPDSDILTGDTVSVYSRGDRLCKSTVRRKEYQESENVPYCTTIQNIYKQ